MNFAVYILVVEDTNDMADEIGRLYPSSTESVLDIPSEAQAIELADEARKQVERLVVR